MRHPALPWPSVDPDGLRSQAAAADRTHRELERIIAAVRDPIIDGWTGTAADNYRAGATRIRADLTSLSTPAAEIPARLIALASAAENVRRRIRELSARLFDAEQDAAHLRRLVELADPADTASRRRPTERWQAAVIETRLIRERAVAEANDLVAELATLDRSLASGLDGLAGAASPSVTSVGPPPGAGPTRPWADIVVRTRRRITAHVLGLRAERRRFGARNLDRVTMLRISELDREIQLHRSFLRPGRQIIDWDPHGDGRLVEVFGDLETAGHVAVVVPGIANTIRNFDEVHRRRAQNLYAAAAGLEPDVAVVAWLGYDTPGFTGAISKSTARESRTALADFVGRFGSPVHLSVVAHSYGTVLTGEAAADGIAADELVFLGSPGTSLDHADDAALADGGQIWAAVSDSDYIVGRAGWGSLACLEVVFGHGRLSDIKRTISPATAISDRVNGACSTDRDGDVLELSHGVNPAHEDFGAIELTTEGVRGHSSYLDAGTSTLAAVAAVVTDRPPPSD